MEILARAKRPGVGRGVRGWCEVGRGVGGGEGKSQVQISRSARGLATLLLTPSVDLPGNIGSFLPYLNVLCHQNPMTSAGNSNLTGSDFRLLGSSYEGLCFILPNFFCTCTAYIIGHDRDTHYLTTSTL